MDALATRMENLKELESSGSFARTLSHYMYVVGNLRDFEDLEPNALRDAVAEDLKAVYLNEGKFCFRLDSPALYKLKHGEEEEFAQMLARHQEEMELSFMMGA